MKSDTSCLAVETVSSNEGLFSNSFDTEFKVGTFKDPISALLKVTSSISSTIPSYINSNTLVFMFRLYLSIFVLTTSPTSRNVFSVVLLSSTVAKSKYFVS